jgi:hypothetical protein
MKLSFYWSWKTWNAMCRTICKKGNSVKYDMINPDLIIFGNENGETAEEVNTRL